MAAENGQTDGDAPTWGIELTPEHPLEEIAELAALAETEGFDLALSSSHYFNRDPFVALSQMASATDDIRLGPGVVNPYETHPVRLAAQAATIDEVSDGRGVFGIGAGDRSALSNLGVEHDRTRTPEIRLTKATRECRRGRYYHDQWVHRPGRRYC